MPLAASQPMIETPSGTSSSTVDRSIRWAPDSCHSKIARPSPGHSSPPGGVAVNFQVPTSGSSFFNACSAVGWSIGERLNAPPRQQLRGCGYLLRRDLSVAYRAAIGPICIMA